MGFAIKFVSWVFVASAVVFAVFNPSQAADALWTVVEAIGTFIGTVMSRATEDVQQL